LTCRTAFLPWKTKPAQCTPVCGAFEGHQQALVAYRKKTVLAGRREGMQPMSWHKMLTILIMLKLKTEPRVFF
jgi:hypothetical protein